MTTFCSLLSAGVFIICIQHCLPHELGPLFDNDEAEYPNNLRRLMHTRIRLPHQDEVEARDLVPPPLFLRFDSNVTYANRTTSSILLAIDKTIAYDHFEVTSCRRFCQENTTKVFHNGDISSNEQKIFLNFTGLRPNLSYYLRVKNCSEHKCTLLTTVYASTLPGIPVKPPVAYKYNFHVDSVGDSWRMVRVLWKSVSEEETAGNGYRVVVKIFEEDRQLDEETYNSYHTNLIRNISHKMHTFDLYSKNYYGISTLSTRIEVPAQNQLLSIPGFVAEVLTGEDYRYQWVIPGTNEPIVNVSMIWCDGIDEDVRTCGKSILEFTELEADDTEIQLKFDNYYKGMALRIDTASSSTGIVRPACENAESEVGLLNRNPQIVASSSHIFIEWPMKCPEEGIVYGVRGYNIYYCPVRRDECLEPEIKLSIETPETTLKTVIGGLTPNTQHKIAGTVLLGDEQEFARQQIFYSTLEEVMVGVAIN